MAEITESFKCGECGMKYDSHEDASDCCKPEVIQGWICEECFEFHRIEESAKKCCAFDFICTACEAEFISQEEAESCCGIGYKHRTATPEELEAGGQLLLTK